MLKKIQTLLLFLFMVLGSPNQFIGLADFVSHMGYACAGLLLPGHGGTAKDFAHSSQQQWTEQVHNEYAIMLSCIKSVFSGSFYELLAINESVCSKECKRSYFTQHRH